MTIDYHVCVRRKTYQIFNLGVKLIKINDFQQILHHLNQEKKSLT